MFPSASQLISAGFPATYPVQELDAPQGSVKTTGAKRLMPRILEWNLSVQREFASNWLAQVAYVGTRAYRLWNHENADLNQPYQPLDSNFSDSTGNFGRPYFAVQPNLASIYPLDLGDLNLMYNSLQASLNHRFSHGFNMLLAYTYAHNLGNADGNVAGYIQDCSRASARIWAGRARPPSPLHCQLSLPIAGRPWAHLRFRYRQSPRRIHWRLGYRWHHHCANRTVGDLDRLQRPEQYRQFQLSLRPTRNPKDFTYDTADQGSFGCTPGKRNILCWYNPTVFTAPPLAPGQQSAHAFGDARIGNLRGPDLVDFDFVLQKHFQIGEFGQIEFRSEFFNIFNHPNLGLPGNQVDVPGGAAITNTAADNRELEFAVKYTF